jgi:uncharacterized protein with PQ loop repeat
MDPTTASSATPMAEWMFEALGWVPAVVFPVATAIQLLAILRSKDSSGVSIPAWCLFAFANICLFAYTEKYGEIESILGSLGTALLNLCVVAAAIRYRSDRRGKPARDGGA